MSADKQFVRVVYIIRRPLNPDDDPKVIIEARKIIKEIFGDYIVPFDLNVYSYYTFENSGLRVRYDKHDLNSIRIDVNLKEEEEDDIFQVFISPTSLGFQCLGALERANSGRIVRCYVSFELVER